MNKFDDLLMKANTRYPHWVKRHKQQNPVIDPEAYHKLWGIDFLRFTRDGYHFWCFAKSEEAHQFVLNYGGTRTSPDVG